MLGCILKLSFSIWMSREEVGEHDEIKIWYFSTRLQLEELMECLDTKYWEMDLCATLGEMKEEIQAHMAITEDLTNKARGNSKAYLTALDGTCFLFSIVSLQLELHLMLPYE